MQDTGVTTMAETSLETALAALQKDWSFVQARLRILEHDVVTTHGRLTLRLQYPSLRDGQATIGDLVEVISTCLIPFSLPRKRIEAVTGAKDALGDFDYMRAVEGLSREARSLFIRARKSADRNGEAGELLLYILTEWLLEAPQILAKMELKTSGQMPVHGSDGVHVRYDPKAKQLLLYSGEAKLHANLGKAIDAAVASIKSGLAPEKLKHEIDLVQRHLDLSGLDDEARGALLAYLDPFDETSNARIDVVTCLIGFNFAGYAATAGDEVPPAAFEAAALAKLAQVGPELAQAFQDADLAHQRIELFLMPVPSVSDLRTLFQNRIGWTTG